MQSVSIPATRMSAAIYDGGRDSFLARPTSRPPSKFDSIEYLEVSSSWKARNGNRRKTSAGAGQPNAGRSTCSSNISNISSNDTRAGVWSWGDGNSSRAETEVTRASSWHEEVSGKRTPWTAPSSCSSKHLKKFMWGPRVACQRQEMDRNIRSTNRGEPATLALALDKCPSTVSSIRSRVPRSFPRTSTTGACDNDSMTLIAGLEPCIRTSITDRVHDGIYDTDMSHKSTLGGRVTRGEIRSPQIFRGGERFADITADQRRQQMMGPGYYDTTPGVGATSKSSKAVSFPRVECKYDTYIRSSFGQTTGSTVGPGLYKWDAATTMPLGLLEFSNIPRHGWKAWSQPPTSTASSNRGPWDDVRDAWGRGGYIEGAVPRACSSYLPREVFRYTSHLDLDHLGKESFATAMRHNPKRYAASFISTREPDWRIIGSPDLGPGTYAVERAEPLTFPAPQGGAGNADPTRPSLPFRMRYTSFDTQRLADGYRTLRPRFSTPRTALYASELPSEKPHRGAATDFGDATPSGIAVLAAKRTGRDLVVYKDARRRWQTAKAMEVAAAAASDPWRIGGKGSRFVRLERPSALDPARDSSRRRAAAAMWKSFNSKKGRQGGDNSVEEA